MRCRISEGNIRTKKFRTHDITRHHRIFVIPEVICPGFRRLGAQPMRLPGSGCGSPLAATSLRLPPKSRPYSELCHVSNVSAHLQSSSQWSSVQMLDQVKAYKLYNAHLFSFLGEECLALPVIEVDQALHRTTAFHYLILFIYIYIYLTITVSFCIAN